MIHPAVLTAFISGAALLCLYTWIALKPATALPALRAYPRTLWPGRILTVICVCWFARNLWQVDLGGFNDLKKLLYVAVPLGIYLVIVFIPDLLSVRGACIFILLGAQPLLVQTRWTGEPASVAVALLVYGLVIKSMLLIAYPHTWIRGIDWWKTNPKFQFPLLLLGWGVGGALLIAGFLSL